MKRFTCDICGRQIEAGEEDEVVSQVQRHLEVDHGMQDDSDVTMPNLANDEDEIREMIEEV